MQIPTFIGKKNKIVPYYLFIIVFMLSIFLLFSFRHLFSYATFGLAFGFVLQRYKFCFTAGLRDIFMLRNFTLTRAILILVGISTLSFSIITSISQKDFSMLIQPIGVHTLIGGVLFGIGMVIAGGCATGVLMRVGEGYQIQFFALLGMLIGSIMGAFNSQWFQTQGFLTLTLNIQEQLGMVKGLALQLTILIILYFLCMYLEKGKKVFNGLSLKNIFVVKNDAQKRYYKGAFFLSIINTLFLYIFLRPLSITIGLTYFAGGIYEKVGGSLENVIILEAGERLLSNPMVFFVSWIIAGSFLSAFLHREFRYRKARSIKYIFMGLVGGFLMGYSARIALGCNFGGFVNAIASMSLHGWVLGLAILLGAYLGSKILIKVAL